jgi:hypothetical protein
VPLHFTSLDLYHQSTQALIFALLSLYFIDVIRRHGKSRPTLAKLVASNTDDTIAEATKEAFDHHASNPDDVAGTLKLLSAPLKGVGPATASLILSVHDPETIIFFSDEAYRWLVTGGKNVSLKYDLKEYEALHKAKKAFQSRIGKVTPIEIEKAAFVVIRENEPVKEKTGPYIPTGKPRGRPPKPEGEKKTAAYVPTGKPRGRPPKAEGAKKVSKTSAASDRGRGRPATQNKSTPTESESNDESGSPEPVTTTPASGKKRGRPAGANAGERSVKKAKA